MISRYSFLERRNKKKRIKEGEEEGAGGEEGLMFENVRASLFHLARANIDQSVRGVKNQQTGEMP